MLKNFKVAIAGVDEQVSIESLVDLSKDFPFVEWGVLYSNIKAGSNRYPGLEWIRRFAARCNKEDIKTSLHICSNGFYDRLLDNQLELVENDFLFEFDLVQANINARDIVYSENEICKVYDDLHLTNKVILQEHEGSLSAIEMFLERPGVNHNNVLILQDGSKGKGVEASYWRAPRVVDGKALSTGFAGGISPHNIDQMIDRAIMALDFRVQPELAWVDMESGVRTDNVFDIKKAEFILKRVSIRMDEIINKKNNTRKAA